MLRPQPRTVVRKIRANGLQRTTCYIIAVLMAALGEELVEMGCIDETIWNETFREHAEACDINELLGRQQQMEVFSTVPLLIIDDLGMRKLPSTAAEDLLEIVMRRYERASTL